MFFSIFFVVVFVDRIYTVIKSALTSVFVRCAWRASSLPTTDTICWVPFHDWCLTWTRWLLIAGDFKDLQGHHARWSASEFFGLHDRKKQDENVERQNKWALSHVRGTYFFSVQLCFFDLLVESNSSSNNNRGIASW